MSRTAKTLTAIPMAIAALSILGYSMSQANPTPIGRDKTLAQGTLGNAMQMIEEGRETFRFDTFGDEAFWGDALRLDEAIKGERFGGVGPGLSRQAEEFTRVFAQQFERSRGITSENYVAFSRTTIDLAKRFSDYKKTMREQQATGKVRTLVWPSFFTHTADEADRFATRLTLYSERQIEFDRDEVVDFWSKTMGEHSGFIAHLLDPDERLLIDQATKLEKAFLDKAFRQVSSDNVMKAANEVLDFKTVAEKGIYAGQIKSIIPPSLASHVRREAVKFVDELKRAA